MKKYFVLAGVLLIAAGASATELDVNSGAAIEGNFGAEIIMDGVVDAAYVLDESPNNETVYRAEFLLDWNDLSFEYCLPQSNPTFRQRAYHSIATVWDLDGVGSLERQFLQILIKCLDDGNIEPRPIVFARTYDPTHPDASGTGTLYKADGGQAIAVNLPRANQPNGWPVRIRIEYQQASAPGANDGYVYLSRATNFDPTTFDGKAQTAIRQSVRDVDRFQLGLPGGADAGTLGSYFLDSFESYRTLAP